MKPELRVKALLYTNTIRSKSAALLIKEREYEKFKDVISRGKLPPDIEKRSMVRLEVKSLEDLANIAIDKDERVIYDEDASLYFIIHDNFLYLYRRSIL